MFVYIGVNPVYGRGFKSKSSDSVYTSPLSLFQPLPRNHLSRVASLHALHTRPAGRKLWRENGKNKSFSVRGNGGVMDGGGGSDGGGGGQTGGSGQLLAHAHHVWPRSLK